MRECLQKNGIALPKRTSGQPGGGLLGGGAGATLPKGVTREKYLAAIRKCGGLAVAGRPRIQSPLFKQSLSKFASCMRANGVNLPSPKSTGKGPIFTTKGLNPSSEKFKAAEAKCGADLRGLFRRRGPAAGGPPAGTPPAGGGAAAR